MADRLHTALPIDELVVNNSNARKEHDTDPGLTASIAAAGLMYPITVKPIGKGKYEVIDGARRLYAIKAGIKSGLIEMDRVPVKIIENGLDSLEYSLHGNLHMAMHPLDEADAIARLARKDEEKEKIAERFGKSVLWVDQRARLSLLIPEVKKLFREREIDLETAMAFTVADDKLQKQIVRARQYDSPGQVKRMATTNKVNAKEALFSLDSWPSDKIERDLFSDDVWLTSIPLFLERQAKAFEAKVQEYKDKGYHEVVVLKSDDYVTINRYAKVEGKIGVKQIGKLSVLLQLANDGRFRCYENMIPNKAAKKTKRSTQGGVDSADVEDIKPMKATEFSAVQEEQLATMAACKLFMHIVEGNPAESLLQYMVYASMARFQKEPWAPDSTLGGNTERRRTGLAATFTMPRGVTDTQTPDGLSYGKWMTDRTPAARKQLYLEAIARMICFPRGEIAKVAKSLPPIGDWFKPDESFFGRFRADQLRDYLKKSGMADEANKPLKKTELVKLALERSRKKGAFQLGFDR